MRCPKPMCRYGEDQNCANPMHRRAVMFKKYKRSNIAEMREYVKGEDLAGISVSDADTPETDMGMIARNPKNHSDQWYVARKYFKDNFEPLLDV